MGRLLVCSGDTSSGRIASFQNFVSLGTILSQKDESNSILWIEIPNGVQMTKSHHFLLDTHNALYLIIVIMVVIMVVFQL